MYNYFLKGNCPLAELNLGEDEESLLFDHKIHRISVCSYSVFSTYWNKRVDKGINSISHMLVSNSIIFNYFLKI